MYAYVMCFNVSVTIIFMLEYMDIPLEERSALAEGLWNHGHPNKAKRKIGSSKYNLCHKELALKEERKCLAHPHHQDPLDPIQSIGPPH